MDIRSLGPMQSLAGTHRAQTHGTETDRGPAAGGVAESAQFNDNAGVAEGAETGDRDADGRQMFDGRRNPARDIQEDSLADAESTPHPRVGSPHQGNQIDFDA